MATAKEQDITEMLNLSTMNFKEARWYCITSTEHGWRWIMQTPAGLWLDVFTNMSRTIYDVYLDRVKYIPPGSANILLEQEDLDAFEAQCAVYDYWHRDANGNPPAEAA